MTRRLACLLALAALPALPAPADAAESSGYTIYCRGGQGATALDVHPSAVLVEKQFLHASAPYDPDTLAPGTCAWPDRAVTADEPYRLLYGRKLGRRDHVTVRGNMQLGLWRLGQGVLMEQHTPADLVAINKLQSRNFIVELRVVADSVRRKRRNGSVRAIKVFNVKEVGVARQIGQSNRG